MSRRGVVGLVLVAVLVPALGSGCSDASGPSDPAGAASAAPAGSAPSPLPSGMTASATTSMAPATTLSPSATAVSPGSLDQNKLAAAITGTLRSRLGADVDVAVSCPAGVAQEKGATSRCGATVDGQLLVYSVTQTSAAGDVDFAPLSAVIDIEALEQQTAEQYAAQAGGSWTADCDTGPRDLAFLVRGVGSLIGCVFASDDGESTAFTVTVTDLDGAVSWVVA